MSLCPRCGRETSSDARFCPSCGLELSASAGPERATALFPEPVLRISRSSTPGEIGDAFVFFGRGIRLQALPERIRDSMYAKNPDSPWARRLPSQKPDAAAPGLLGKYNRSGSIFPIASHAEAVRAVKELAGLVDRPSRISIMMGVVHFGCCRIRETPVTTFFPRGLDIQGGMTMSGYAIVSFAKTEAQLRQSVADLEKDLVNQGLFGPLTARDQLPGRGEDDPRAFDYFANDSDVWSSEG
jgi:hypothetical protein